MTRTIYEKSSLNQRHKLPYGIEQFTAHWKRFSRLKNEMYLKRLAEIMAEK